MTRKVIRRAVAALALSAYALGGAWADETEHDHDHDHHKIVAGPNGGRVLHDVEPHLEFFVDDDRKVRITALDDELRPVAIAGQKVNVIAGQRSAPTRLKFSEVDGVLVSDGKLPDGNGFPVVIRIKASPDADTVTARLNLDLRVCGECKNKEYACTCDHHHGDDHEHEGEHE